MAHFDLIIIGAGPGGYVAADRAGARGKRVLLIERGHLGGLCLNAGCIPSKALLASARLYDSLNNAAKFGVMVDQPSFSLSAAIARQQAVIAGLRDGIAYQMNRRAVTVIGGEAALIDRQTVRVNDETHSADALILATGSRLIKPELSGIDQTHVFNLSDALTLERLPQQLAVLGVDSLALGIGTIYRLLGVRVTFIAEAAQLLPDFEPDIVSTLKLEMRNADFHLNARVEAIGGDSVTILKGDERQTVPADTVIYSAGRAPSIDGFVQIGLDVGGGRLRVDDQMRTNLPNVYGIGDVTGGLWAGAASRMAEVAVNTLCGTPDRYRPDQVPSVVYTSPEIACVGLTEAAAMQAGYTVRTARLPMNANGRFLTDYEDKRGLCKLVADAETGQLLGAHLITPNASDLITGLVAMIADEFRLQELRALSFAHPTLSELVREIAHELDFR